MTIEKATGKAAPYRAGDRLFFLFLDGVLRGPFEVAAGPGRFPNPGTCRLRALPETVSAPDPALGFEGPYAPGDDAGEFGVDDLWRDIPGLREMAAAKARAWEVFMRSHRERATTPYEGWASMERTPEDRVAVAEARRLTDEMSVHHPYPRRKVWWKPKAAA